MNGAVGAASRDSVSWRRRAACIGEDPELFFPVSSSGPALAQIAAAKAVCARCSVRDACLRYAVTTGQAYGIWGGLTEDERRVLHHRYLCRHGRRAVHSLLATLAWISPGRHAVRRR